MKEFSITINLCKPPMNHENMHALYFLSCATRSEYNTYSIVHKSVSYSEYLKILYKFIRCFLFSKEHYDKILKNFILNSSEELLEGKLHKADGPALMDYDRYY